MREINRRSFIKRVLGFLGISLAGSELLRTKESIITNGANETQKWCLPGRHQWVVDKYLKQLETPEEQQPIYLVTSKQLEFWKQHKIIPEEMNFGDMIFGCKLTEIKWLQTVEPLLHRHSA